MAKLVSFVVYWFYILFLRKSPIMKFKTICFVNFSLEDLRYPLSLMCVMTTVWNVSKYGVFLVRIFPHSDWIRRDTNDTNAGKYRAKKNSVFGHFSRSGHWPILCHWLFQYPLKTSENQKFFNVIRGYRKRAVPWNKLSRGLNGWYTSPPRSTAKIILCRFY